MLKGEARQNSRRLPFSIVTHRVSSAVPSRSPHISLPAPLSAAAAAAVMCVQVWPLINIVNFKFIPPKLQVLFGNLASIFWMTCQTHMTRATAQPQSIRGPPEALCLCCEWIGHSLLTAAFV